MSGGGHIIGLGGVFVVSADPEGLKAWYRDTLGIDITEYGASFKSAQDPSGDQVYQVWSVFKADTPYLKPSEKDFMVNFRVDDLDTFAETLKSRGVELLDGGVVKEPYGKFAWILDPDGTKIELWEQIGDAP